VAAAEGDPFVRGAGVLVCLGIGASFHGCAAPAADSPARAALTAESRPDSPRPPPSRTIRLSGTLEAVRTTRVAVPAISGPGYELTLTRIVPNGSGVQEGDVIAEFDPLQQLDEARQSAARFDDLSFQVRQKAADNTAAAEKRRSERQQAQATLEKALLEVSKAPVQSEAEATRNRLLADKARAQLESLDRRHPDEERADRAALRVLELQRDRQRAVNDRARANLEKLRVRAPLGGMAAHATRYNNGAMVRPQEGDQLTRGNTLLSIFDPGQMLVRVSVAEPDGALLRQGLEAVVYVDAFPDVALRARFVSASPVAAAPVLSSGVKTFRAVFRLDQTDPRLMPDLSAAVVFKAAGGPPRAGDAVAPATGASR
jgi:multidrug efflux pump subunit AcrA (membrane-fusion protein)